MWQRIKCWLGFHSFICTDVWLGGDVEKRKHICKHCGKIKK